MMNVVRLFCVLLVAVPGKLQETDFFDCENKKLELVFVQDASYSVSEHSFNQSKEFLSDTVRQLPIGQDKIRVALVRFGTIADIISGLSESSDVTAVTDAIDGMEYVVGSTNTALAMRVVREKVLKEARAEADSVVVVITDGASNSPRKTRSETQKLRNQHVRLVWLYIDGPDSGGLGREREGMIRKGDTTFGVSSFQDLGVETMARILNASCEDVPEPITVAPKEHSTKAEIEGSSAGASESANPDFGSGEVISSSLEPILPSESNETSPYSVADNATGSTQGPNTSSVLTEDLSSVSAANSSSIPLQEEDLLPVVTTTEKNEENLDTDEETKGVNFDPKTVTETTVTSLVENLDNSSKMASSSAADDKTTGTSNDTTGDNFVTLPPGLTATDGPEEKASKTKVEGEEGEGSWKNSKPKIIATVVGVFAIAAIASGIVFILRRRRAKRRDKEDIQKKMQETNKV